MQITREDLNPCTVKLAVVCDPTEVNEGFTRAYKQLSKKVRVPGFRPGHVPKHILENVVDKEDLRETAAEAIVQAAYKNALTDQKLEPEPTIRPIVQLTAIEEEPAKCEFNVKVPLPPQIELGEAKGLPVEKAEPKVTDEEVDLQIEELRRRRSSRESVTDRGVQEGDICVVNVRADGDKAEGRNFMTVAGQTFPQLDQTLMGMSVEEMKNVSLTFPENFQEKDWAGKLLNCQVTINSISAVKLPELDEEFAKALKSESVDDLRTRLRSLIEDAKNEAAREIMTDKLLDTLLERSKIDVPDPMWESLAERRLAETAEEQAREGKNLEEYAKENGMTLEELAEAWRQKAKHHVMRALVIRELFTREKMSLSNADLNVELRTMAAEYDETADEMLNILKKNEAMEELHFRAISRKVADFLIEHADPKGAAKAKAPKGAKA